MHLTIRQMVLCSLFVALIVVGAFIKIPIPMVPFTLQFLFTTLAGTLLGARLGCLSVVFYVVLGLLGLPIFAEGGGFAYVLKPSFGYLIGFCLGTYVTGYLVAQGRPSFTRLCLANAAGLTVVYGLGILYYFGVCHYVLLTPIAWSTLLLYGLVLAVPGDIVLCVVGALLAKRLLPVICRRKEKPDWLTNLAR